MILFCLQPAFADKLESSTPNTRNSEPGTILIQHLKSNIQHHGFSIRENPFKYSGYYHDAESGNYYLNARYYSPALKRFTSRDTYDLADRYTYCNGNPFNNLDSTGHMPKWLRAVMGGVFVVYGAYSFGIGIGVGSWLYSQRSSFRRLTAML